MARGSCRKLASFFPFSSSRQLARGWEAQKYSGPFLLTPPHLLSLFLHLFALGEEKGNGRNGKGKEAPIKRSWRGRKEERRGWYKGLLAGKSKSTNRYGFHPVSTRILVPTQTRVLSASFKTVFLHQLANAPHPSPPKYLGQKRGRVGRCNLGASPRKGEGSNCPWAKGGRG